MNTEDRIDRKANFEKLKNFFNANIQIKEEIFNLAPTEMDDIDEETRIRYTDGIEKALKNLEIEFHDIVQSFDFGTEVNEAIKKHFNDVREQLLIGKYDSGIIQKIYREQFSNMNKQLVELTKEVCVGYTMPSSQDLLQLIEKSKTINELLHVIHSYITNNEEILQSMPIINSKENKNNEQITLYGEETEFSKKIFEEFPVESKSGITDIISMKNKILMMVRDVGHALSIDIDTSKEDDIICKYFVPKLCNIDMIKALPGLNKVSESGATGMFQTTKDELSKKLFDFIEKVPTDLDIPIPKQHLEVKAVLNEVEKNAKNGTLSFLKLINKYSKASNILGINTFNSNNLEYDLRVNLEKVGDAFLNEFTSIDNSDLNDAELLEMTLKYENAKQLLQEMPELSQNYDKNSILDLKNNLNQKVQEIIYRTKVYRLNTEKEIALSEKDTVLNKLLGKTALKEAKARNIDARINYSAKEREIANPTNSVKEMLYGMYECAYKYNGGILTQEMIETEDAIRKVFSNLPDKTTLMQSVFNTRNEWITSSARKKRNACMDIQ